MSVRTAEAMIAADSSRAIEIADRIWWVGHHLVGDPFQCHAYLIEHGDQSVLIDPGSMVTFKHTLRKIEQVLPFFQIRYFVCQHQDPDITGALPMLDKMVVRDDAALVTHWRAWCLLKHCDLELPPWLIDENGWRLDLGGRALQFVFTPYLHFPGAFCTFDTQDGVLFSSDIFGGFTEEPSLVAQDESYFEAIRSFHEHYMPSRDILLHGLNRLEQLPIELAAPQHGSLIPKNLLPYIIEKLKSLECGLYLMVKEDSDILRLLRLNKLLRELLNTMTLYRDFKEVGRATLALIRDMLPACKSLEFFALGNEGEVWHLGPKGRYRGRVLADPPNFCTELLGLSPEARRAEPGEYLQRDIPLENGAAGEGAVEPALLFSLARTDTEQISALAVIRLTDPIQLTAEVEQILSQIYMPLEVAIERERIHRLLELERQQIYERSIRDPLTGLYTRVYMQETVKRWLALQDRQEQVSVGMVMLDVDHFKRVNDTHGHLVGDEILRRIGHALSEETRDGDIAVRYGGEEFAVFQASCSSLEDAERLDERIREAVTKVEVPEAMSGQQLTISAGAAIRGSGEDLQALIRRADAALYEAKRKGRNRTCTAEYSQVKITVTA